MLDIQRVVFYFCVFMATLAIIGGKYGHSCAGMFAVACPTFMNAQFLALLCKPDFFESRNGMSVVGSLMTALTGGIIHSFVTHVDVGFMLVYL